MLDLIIKYFQELFRNKRYSLLSGYHLQRTAAETSQGDLAFINADINCIYTCNTVKQLNELIKNRIVSHTLLDTDETSMFLVFQILYFKKLGNDYIFFLLLLCNLHIPNIIRFSVIQVILIKKRLFSMLNCLILQSYDIKQFKTS